MIRSALSVVLGFLTLGLGLSTAWLMATNRERGAELDHLQRWTEISARRNDTVRAVVERLELELLILPPGEPDDELGGEPEVQVP